VDFGEEGGRFKALGGAKNKGQKKGGGCDRLGFDFGEKKVGE